MSTNNKHKSESISCPRCGAGSENILHRYTSSTGRKQLTCVSPDCKNEKHPRGLGFIILPNGTTYPRSKTNNKPRQKDVSKLWANKLEQEYQKYPSRMPESTKKSVCYYIVSEEYSKTMTKPPCSKTFTRWWRKHYPKRFSH